MPLPKAVMFDMDGLIFDTEKLYKAAWQSSVEKLGFVIAEDLWSTFIGVRNEECERTLAEEFGKHFPLDRFSAMWKEAFAQFFEGKGVDYNAGFAELFSYLKSKNYIVGLTTSSYTEDIQRNFRGKKELELFDLIVSGEDVSQSKPHPETYLKAAEKAGIPPSDMLVFEDSVSGMHSAINAGCMAVMVRGIQPPDEFVKQKAFMILDSLTEAAGRIFEAD
jgi:HAD superfamily hydrolase (TIGR01509 family)